MHDLRFIFTTNFRILSILAFWVLMLSVPPQALGQKRVKLKHADVQRGGIKDGVRIDKLIGDVILVQNKTTIYHCNSSTQCYRCVAHGPHA